MRYMIIVKSTEPSPPPSSELIAAMGRFNEELIKAGALLVAEGLQPSKSGARIEKKDGRVVISDGPFAEAKELIGGFWIIKAADRAGALQWVRKIPLTEGDRLELRLVSEVSDFVSDEISAEALAKEQAWRDGHNNP